MIIIQIMFEAKLNTNFILLWWLLARSGEIECIELDQNFVINSINTLAVLRFDYNVSVGKSRRVWKVIMIVDIIILIKFKLKMNVCMVKYFEFVISLL